MVKKVNMVLFSTVTELLVFCNCCKHLCIGTFLSHRPRKLSPAVMSTSHESPCIHAWAVQGNSCDTCHFPLPSHLCTGSCGTAVHLDLFWIQYMLKKFVSKATNATTDRQVAESECEFMGLSCKELLFPLYSPESTLYWINFLSLSLSHTHTHSLTHALTTTTNFLTIILIFLYQTFRRRERVLK